MSMQSCTYCCAITAIMAAVFFGLLSIMALNENEVFLDHKGSGIESQEETFDLSIEVALVIQ